MKYRAEIDGLRALAVVPVILFHAGFELFSGGFVGVDVFFVISGYLITTILIEDIEKERFSIVRFYERRARRILPALFLVMLLCIPFAWMWMLPSQMKSFSQSLVAVSFFVSNVLFWRESGYFAAAAEEKPLLHTWSLAVEEQYYLLFPIFLFLAWRFGKNRVFWTIVVLAAISLALSEWGWRYKDAANFYLAPTRAWELFAGSIAAFIAQEKGVQKNNPLALVGLAAIVFAIFVYDDGTPFPSVYALVPVLGVVLLILFADKETLAAKLLSTKLCVGIGLISYSAYLWHQPLFAFARIRQLDHPSTFLMLMLSGASIILAYLSWKYVERPFRDAELFTRRRILTASAAGMMFFIILGSGGNIFSKNVESFWLSTQTEELQARYKLLRDADPETSNWGANEKNTQKIGMCFFNVKNLTPDLENEIIECRKKYGEGVLILGDSHAIDLFGVVASRFKDPFIIGVTQSNCRPHENHSYCHYNKVEEFIRANSDVFKLVVYEQAGFYLMKQSDGTKGSRIMFSDAPIDSAVTNVVVDEDHVRMTAEFLGRLSEMVAVKWFLPRAGPHINQNIIVRKGCDFAYSYRPNQFETFLKLDEYITDLVAQKYGKALSTVSQNKLFRFNLPEDFMSCDAIYWSDGDHLSATGEEFFGKRLPMTFLEAE